jgi:hypothetical protein
MLNITDEEREFLTEFLEEKYKQMLHEINHTDTLEYKEMLRHKLDLLEGLISKLGSESKQFNQ